MQRMWDGAKCSSPSVYCHYFLCIPTCIFATKVTTARCCMFRSFEQETLLRTLMFERDDRSLTATSPELSTMAMIATQDESIEQTTYGDDNFSQWNDDSKRTTDVPYSEDNDQKDNDDFDDDMNHEVVLDEEDLSMTKENQRRRRGKRQMVLLLFVSVLMLGLLGVLAFQIVWLSQNMPQQGSGDEQGVVVSPDKVASSSLIPDCSTSRSNKVPYDPRHPQLELHFTKWTTDGNIRHSLANDTELELLEQAIVDGYNRFTGTGCNDWEYSRWMYNISFVNQTLETDMALIAKDEHNDKAKVDIQFEFESSLVVIFDTDISCEGCDDYIAFASFYPDTFDNVVVNVDNATTIEVDSNKRRRLTQFARPDEIEGNVKQHRMDDVRGQQRLRNRKMENNVLLNVDAAGILSEIYSSIIEARLEIGEMTQVVITTVSESDGNVTRVAVRKSGISDTEGSSGTSKDNEKEKKDVTDRKDDRGEIDTSDP